MEAVRESSREVTTVSSLVPLVRRLAGRFRRDYWTPADREDIAQEGFIGLMEAAARFEPDRGCSLSTYAGQRVMGAMFDHVRTICRRSRERPTDELPQELQRYRPERGDMDAPRSAESGVMLVRFREFLGGNLDGLSFLDDDERGIISMRFFEGKSCREVSEALGISAATVCRVERTALVRLRKNFLLKYCGPAATGGGTSRDAAARGGHADDRRGPGARSGESAGSVTGEATRPDNAIPTIEDILASLAL